MIRTELASASADIFTVSEMRMCWHLSLAGIKISTIIWPGSANTEHYHLKLTETHSSLSFLSITPSYYLFLHIVVTFTNKFDEREQIEIVTHQDLYTHWQPTQTQSCRNKQTRTHSNLDNHPNSFASQEKFLQELLALRSWWREKQNETKTKKLVFVYATRVVFAMGAGRNC